MCPRCRGPAESGYLIGKHQQLRWSRARRGLTIFHGVPLVKSRERSWTDWLYAPGIGAWRCPACRLAWFGYDVVDAERPGRERLAVLILGSILLLCGALPAVFGIALMRAGMSLPALVFWDGIPVAATLSLLGADLVVHGVRLPRA